MNRRMWMGGLLALTLAAAGPMGCEADVYDDGGIVEVDREPPPPQVEVVPAAPYPDAVWIGGRWVWRGGNHVWVAGRYVRPRPGYVYESHRWYRSGNRWRYEPGRWRRR
jgi:pimeloyl-ACP methyl ester carboxylesterase